MILIKYTRFIIVLLLCCAAPAFSHGIETPHDSTNNPDRLPKTARFVPHTVVVKFRTNTKSSLTKHAAGLSSLTPAYMRFGITQTEQMYPDHAEAFTSEGRDLGIDRLYRMYFSAETDPITVAKALSAIPDVEYAEPEQIHELLYRPNDASLGQQYAINLMHLPEAWDITKGDSSVVIAIVDTGVQWTHEDLNANIWINSGEDVNHDGKYTIADINQVDDDHDGYVDDIIGLDLVGSTGNNGALYYDNDPLPTPTGNPHGTHVSGIAAAVGDNGIGIAGVAYKCRIMPVKCGSDDGANSVLRGYDGIVYAADHGASVINCSWGGSGYLRSEIDRIDYAISKGAVVVAAAGNGGNETQITPGAYPNVLCVANTDSNDRLHYSSTRGTWVSISAPGTDILSTVSNNNSSYAGGGWTGTSMASPQVAGVVALVRSYRKDLTPLQAAEQVRVTADPIDSLQYVQNRGKIGHGRVNAYRALTVSSPAVRLVQWSVSDSATGNDNGILDRGETFTLTMRWKNFLNPTKNAVVTLSSTNAHVTIQNPVFNIGALGTNEERGNESAPFLITLADVEAPNETIDLNYTIVDGTYEDQGGVTTFQQPTYRDHNYNDITTTIACSGHLGFDDFSGLRGSGFIYQNNTYNVLFEGALLIGAKINGTASVVDVARNESGTSQSTDFLATDAVTMITDAGANVQRGKARFTDGNASLADLVGVDVQLHSYEFLDPGDSNFVILKYTIRNTSQNTLQSLHAGLFFDWDISPGGTNDISKFDTTTQTGYAYDAGYQVPTKVAETVLTRDKPTHFVTIVNSDTDDAPPVFGIYNGYTKNEKWRSISSGIWHTEFGPTDLSNVIANGPYDLAPNDSCIIAFALMASTDMKSLLNTTPRALAKWEDMNRVHTAVDDPAEDISFSLEQNFPNPLTTSHGKSATVTYSLPKQTMVQLHVVDLLGHAILLLNEMQPEGRHSLQFTMPHLPSGEYLLRLTADGKSRTRKLSIIH